MREINTERLEKDTRRVLNHPFWISDLNSEQSYIRFHDDTDGTRTGAVCVRFSQDGDVWLDVQPTHTGGSLRFRTSLGGGQSQRVRNALMILALAIKLDNEEGSQDIDS